MYEQRTNCIIQTGPIAQWIESGTSNPVMVVRFHLGSRKFKSNQHELRSSEFITQRRKELSGKNKKSLKPIIRLFMAGETSPWHMAVYDVPPQAECKRRIVPKVRNRPVNRSDRRRVVSFIGKVCAVLMAHTFFLEAHHRKNHREERDRLCNTDNQHVLCKPLAGFSLGVGGGGGGHSLADG